MAGILPVRPDAPSEEALRRGGEVLLRGECLALPTDTLYGLCAKALDPRAIERLFALKGRSEPKGAPVLIGHRDQLSLLAGVPSPRARGVMEVLWPGPLTLILPAKKRLSPLLRGEDGLGIAVRLPGQALCRLLALAAGPFAATSANLPGETPLAEAAAVAATFGEGLGLILDGGAAERGMPSTIVDARAGRPVLLRKGAVPFEAVVGAWNRMGERGSPE